MNCKGSPRESAKHTVGVSRGCDEYHPSHELTEGEEVPSITNLFIFLQTGYNLQLKLNKTDYGSSLVWALSLGNFLGR